MWYDNRPKEFCGGAGSQRGPAEELGGGGMGKRVLICLALLLGMMGLVGCEFGSVEEMYALPKSSEAYVNLQAKINQEKGNAEYIAPLSGENRQTIQLVDVDGDGAQEAVAFFRDITAEAPLKIVIFKQDDRGEYQAYTRIEGVGSEIESIDYLDLGGAGGVDILVGWQVSTAVHSLVGYTITDGEPVEIMRSGYSRYLTADLDSDGQEEVILSQAGSSNSPTPRIEYYDNREGMMELMSTAPLSDGATDISSWQAGLLEGDVPALFVTSFFGKDVLITDVFCLKQSNELKNISCNSSLRHSESLFHYYTGVQPEDINEDGLMDVPVAKAVASYRDSSVDGFWWLSWVNYRADGTKTVVMTTYHSGDGWYLEIPDSWTGDFSMNQQESSTIGVRTVTFARGLETDQESTVAPFLEISCLTGSDRTRQARESGQIMLYSDTVAVYTAQLLPGDWDCGLDEKSLVDSFHASASGWDTVG